MKSILMSIKPKWVEKIASGEKTVEVRKSVPKCGTQFKVYIYCTESGTPLFNNSGKVTTDGLFYAGIDKFMYRINGMVVGEFVCDEVIKAVPDYEPYFKKFFNYGFFDKNGEKFEDCLTDDEKADYANEQTLYGLHISDLKIYDKPKEFWEFRKPCDRKCDSDCSYFYEDAYEYACTNVITRPPQSWFYVEEL